MLNSEEKKYSNSCCPKKKFGTKQLYHNNDYLADKHHGFLFRSEMVFRTTRELEYFFFQNLTLGYMTKTLNQIIFFPSTKIRIFFSATLGAVSHSFYE